MFSKGSKGPIRGWPKSDHIAESCPRCILGACKKESGANNKRSLLSRTTKKKGMGMPGWRLAALQRNELLFRCPKTHSPTALCPTHTHLRSMAADSRYPVCPSTGIVSFIAEGDLSDRDRAVQQHYDRLSRIRLSPFFETIRHKNALAQSAHVVGTDGLRAGSKILEVGAGTGSNSVGLSTRPIGCDFIGLDLSWCSLEEASRRPTVDVCVHGKAEQLPFTSGVFNVVFMCHGNLHLLPDVTSVVQEMRRVCDPVRGTVTILDVTTKKFLSHPERFPFLPAADEDINTIATRCAPNRVVESLIHLGEEPEVDHFDDGNMWRVVFRRK